MLIKMKKKFFSEDKLIPGIIKEEEKIKKAIGYNLDLKLHENVNVIPILFSDNRWSYALLDMVEKLIDDENNSNNDDVIRFDEAAKKIGVSKLTLERWYRWYNNRLDSNLKGKIPKLPPTITIKRVKHFYVHQLSDLKNFANFYKKSWGMMRNECSYKKNNKRSKENGFNKSYE